jgi:hypothetical protein
MDLTAIFLPVSRSQFNRFFADCLCTAALEKADHRAMIRAHLYGLYQFFGDQLAFRWAAQTCPAPVVPSAANAHWSLAIHLRCFRGNGTRE